MIAGFFGLFDQPRISQSHSAPTCAEVEWGDQWLAMLGGALLG